MEPSSNYLICAQCGERIRYSWIQIIVRDGLMDDDYIDTVGFLCEQDCLIDYAATVGGLMLTEKNNDE